MQLLGFNYFTKIRLYLLKRINRKTTDSFFKKKLTINTNSHEHNR